MSNIKYKYKQRILQHMIDSYQCPLSTSVQKLHQESEQIFKTKLKQLQTNTIHKNTESRRSYSSGDSVEISIDYNFDIEIDIGNGMIQSMHINSDSQPIQLAKDICRKHRLKDNVIVILAQSIKQQQQRQKQLALNQYYEDQKMIYQGINRRQEVKEVMLKEDYSRNKQKHCLVQLKNLQHNNKSNNNKHERYQINTLKNTIQTTTKTIEEKQNESQRINEISEQIILRKGKQHILAQKQRKSGKKISRILRQKQQAQYLVDKQCYFHPKINPISYQVDLITQQHTEQARHHLLYKNYQKIEQKKQHMRKMSIQAFTFKPKINAISKIIVDSKQYQRYKQPVKNIKNQPKIQTIRKSQQKIKRKNSQPIGHHLYSEAIKQKKRLQLKMSTLEKQSKNQGNLKILNYSEHLIKDKRQQGIRNIFKLLTNFPHKILHYSSIDINSEILKRQKIRILKPLLYEMKQIQASLNEEQFVQAALKLLKYLCPFQKAEIIDLNDKNLQIEHQSYKTQNRINTHSQQLLKHKGYDKINIYQRGIVRRRYSKEKLQRGMQEKVRHQLQNCTFKPQINHFEE